MKWFDLFSDKRSQTSLKSGDDVAQNHSPKSYRDISKRGPINLVSGLFDTQKSYTPFTLRRHIHHFCEHIQEYVWRLTRGHMSIIIMIAVLAYAIYGLGFILRTELHLRTINSNPGALVTESGISTLRDMRRDYQILAPVLGNPFFPIEPLATYGRVLDIGYDLIQRTSKFQDIEEDIMAWREVADTKSIFPIVREVMRWFSGMDSDIRKLHTMIQAQAPEIESEGAFTLWTNLLKHEDIWYSLLGREKPTRILLLNQNSDELRAGGWFPGTAFIIEFDEGKMTRFEFFDIYALDWNLTWYRPSPEGINQFKSINYPGKPVEFEIRDANYYPLFHESAVKLDELAQEAGIWPLDMVVGINQKFLEDMVRLVEPLTIQGIPMKIDHRNVTLILSMLVEGKKTLEWTPKWTVKILSDALLRELQAQHKEQQAALIFAGHVYNGEFIAWSSRPDVQAALDSLGIFDRWYGKKEDWVYPLFTSISRNKSDRLMERTFEINRTNVCDRTLTLRQKHWFDLIEAARIKGLAHELGLEDKLTSLLPIQGGGDNVQYLRFIVPPGTQLLSQWAFAIADENPDFTTIHGYETTNPGTTKETTISYRLPIGYCSEETQFFKQPGLRNTRVVIQKNGVKVYQKFYE